MQLPRIISGPALLSQGVSRNVRGKVTIGFFPDWLASGQNPPRSSTDFQFYPDDQFGVSALRQRYSIDLLPSLANQPVL